MTRNARLAAILAVSLCGVAPNSLAIAQEAGSNPALEQILGNMTPDQRKELLRALITAETKPRDQNPDEADQDSPVGRPGGPPIGDGEGQVRGRPNGPPVGGPGGQADGRGRQGQAGSSLPPLPSPGDAFDEALKRELRLETGQIRRARQRLYDTQKAYAEPPFEINGRSRTVSFSFQPGRPEVKIVVAPDRVTGIQIFDSTGQPWPIENYINGSPRRFQIGSNGEGKHMLWIKPQADAGEGNMLLVLQGARAQVPITIEIGGAMDRGVDLMADVPHPDRQVSGEPVPTAPIAGGDIMRAVIDGVPPEGAVPMSVQGIQGEAWLIGGDLYLRTPVRIMSPRPRDHLRGAGGWYGFKLPNVPVLLAPDPNGGLPIEVKIARARGARPEAAPLIPIGGSGGRGAGARVPMEQQQPQAGAGTPMQQQFAMPGTGQQTLPMPLGYQQSFQDQTGGGQMSPGSRMGSAYQQPVPGYQVAPGGYNHSLDRRNPATPAIPR